MLRSVYFFNLCLLIPSILSAGAGGVLDDASGIIRAEEPPAIIIPVDEEEETPLSGDEAVSENKGTDGSILSAGFSSHEDYDLLTLQGASGNEMPDEDGDGTIAGYTNLGLAHVDSHLNVRKEPREDAELLGKMVNNAGCEILDLEGDWVHIKSGKLEGYAKAEFLLMGSQAVAAAQDALTLMGTVTTTTLFVRNEPRGDSPILTMIPFGEAYEVVEGNGSDEWVKIVIDEDEGYVSTEYLNIAEKLETAVSMQELRKGQGVSDLRVDIINYAMQFIGNRYVWGGTSLTKGADCSGYVQSVFKKFGIYLPRTSREQARVGTKISASNVQPGDLVFYAKNGRINHVAIYIGGGQVVNASNPRNGIKISNMNYRKTAAIRRVIKQ